MIAVQSYFLYCLLLDKGKKKTQYIHSVHINSRWTPRRHRRDGFTCVAPLHTSIRTAHALFAITGELHAWVNTNRHTTFFFYYTYILVCVYAHYTHVHTHKHTHTQTCTCCWMVVNLATAPAAMGSVAAMATASPSLTQYKNKWRTQHSLSVCLLLSRVSYLLYSCLLWFQFSNHTCNL